MCYFDIQNPDPNTLDDLVDLLWFPFGHWPSVSDLVSDLVWISHVRTGGMTCRGYDNATVSIRFPDGAGWGQSVLLLPEQNVTTVAGLLRNNYTLEVDVNNPGLGT